MVVLPSRCLELRCVVAMETDVSVKVNEMTGWNNVEGQTGHTLFMSSV